MIPQNIKKEHVLKALKEIDKAGVPEGRSSRKFVLEHEGKRYPPKYVLSLANKYANGKELDSEEFSGGTESNSFLESLGFDIKDLKHSDRKIFKRARAAGEIRKRGLSHNERCPKCKGTIKKLLEKIWGRVEESPKFDIGTLPEDFKDLPCYPSLKKIFQALQDYRGFKDFVKAKTLPNSDLFIPEPGFVFEYDEKQHFTLPRKVALENYPEDLMLGFDKKRWGRLCEKINAKNNHPKKYRDEQRAWYETLRDFLPLIKGFKPTVRICVKDYEWCSLNPDNPSDVEKFKALVKGEASEWMVEVREDPDPYLGRIIVAVRRDWEGNLEKARSVLEAVYNHWPKDKKVKFLMTCGGFVQFGWPHTLTVKDIGDNKSPENEAVRTLVKEAEKCARQLLDGGLREKLRAITDYLTLGIDSFKSKISMTENIITQPHVELVFLVDLRTGDFYWTGKSYPTSGQQYGLVRITDLDKHFLSLEDVGKLMVLGCHDLSMFNNRNWENTGTWRRKIKIGFRKLAQEEKPVLVLHHPHTTVKVTTWRNAWSTLERTVDTVRQCAGAGRYYEPDRPVKKYDPLKDVLAATKRTNSIDFIIEEPSP